MEILSIVGAIISVLGVVATGVFTIINRRGGEKAKREPTWVELETANRELRKEMADRDRENDERFEKLEKEVRDLQRQVRTTEWAASHVMREASEQLDGVPVFTPAYADPIIHLIPHRWRPQPLV